MINLNQADDDLNSLAKSSLNQKQSVYAAGTGVATTISSANSATGTVASPGKSGFGGADRPGRRIYNPLSKLASYTYNITLYMITPDAYEQFVASGRQKIDAISAATTTGGTGTPGLKPGAYIIAQSGGVNNTTSKRAPGFELDFYIDNLKFTTLTSSKSTGTSTGSVANYEFQITEPYGFSFMSNLKKAAAALQEYSNNSSYKQLSSTWKQFYILGIRFYGYDKEGNIVKPASELYGEPIDPAGTEALFENYYDIQFSDIKFRLDGKAAVYTISAVGTSGQNMLGTKRGRIPTGGTFSGKTVSDALIGEDGLFTKLNKQQADLLNTDNPSITYPNKYKVNFLGNAVLELGEASLVTKADVDKIRWPGSGARTTTESNDAAGGQPPSNTAKTFTFNNDTAIIQAIENIIKQSSFMIDALQTVFANTSEPDPKKKNLPTIKNEDPAKIKWFTVCTEITKADWDPKISDWAYELNYNIQLYEIPSIGSPYLGGTSNYYGPHKRYDYWFTGKNSEVIDFNLQLDALYFNAVLNLPNPPDKQPDTTAQSPGSQRETTNTSQVQSGASTTNTNTTSNNTGLKSNPPIGTQPDNAAGTAIEGGAVSVAPGLNPGGDKTGGKGATMAAQNSVTTYLTDPGAYTNVTMKILGDPDYLIRDATTSIASLYNQFYGTDGFTINAQGGQVFVELAFKEAKDYNDDTGLMTINDDVFFMNYPDYIKEISKGALVLLLTEVDSTFSGGKFEQTLKLMSPSFAGTTSTTTPTQPKDPVPATTTTTAGNEN